MNKSFPIWLTQRSRYLPLFFAMWAGIIVTLYLFRFPLPQPNAENPYPAVALTIWIIWIALASGSALLRLLTLPTLLRAEHVLFSTAIGFAALAYAIFGLGLAHLLFSSVVYGMLIVLTILSIRECQPLFTNIRHYLQRPYHITKLDLALGTLLFGLFGYHLLGTLIPPLLFDALVYHLAIPKLYLLNHSIEYIPYSFFSNFPFFMEMLYTLGLAVQGPLVVNLLNYVIHLLMLASLYSLARAYCNHRIALLSVLIFYTVPWVGMESFLPYIDVGLALYVVLALYALLNWISRRHSGWLIVCGVCSGVGISIKYLGTHNAVVMGFSVVGWLLWRGTHPPTPSLTKRGGEEGNASQVSGSPSLSKRGGWGVSSSLMILRTILIFAVPAILCGAPWYLKSLIFTGNPIYPFVFGGGEWSAEMLQRYMNAYHVGFGTFFQSLLTFFKLPWELVFSFNLTPSNVPIGPVFLVFLPLLLFVRRVPPVIQYCVGASVLLVAFWFNTSPQSRFLIPTLPLLSIATAYAIEQISTESRTAWLKRIAYALLILLLLSNIAWEMIYVHAFFDPFEVMMGLESTHDYLSRQRPDIYPITHYANNMLPSDAKILFIGDTRGYYADRPFIANTAYDKTPIVELAHASETTEELAEHLGELGVTHIIFNRREGARLYKDYEYLHWKTPQDEQLFWEFYQTRLKQLKSINDSELLEVIY